MRQLTFFNDKITWKWKKDATNSNPLSNRNKKSLNPGVKKHYYFNNKKKIYISKNKLEIYLKKKTDTSQVTYKQSIQKARDF